MSENQRPTLSKEDDTQAFAKLVRRGPNEPPEDQASSEIRSGLELSPFATIAGSFGVPLEDPIESSKEIAFDPVIDSDPELAVPLPILKHDAKAAANASPPMERPRPPGSDIRPTFEIAPAVGDAPSHISTKIERASATTAEVASPVRLTALPRSPLIATATPQKITMILEPASLGEVKVTLSLVAQAARLHVVATTEAAFAALSADRDILMPLIQKIADGPVQVSVQGPSETSQSASFTASREAEGRSFDTHSDASSEGGRNRHLADRDQQGRSQEKPDPKSVADGKNAQSIYI